jgi:hypothetical protein
MTENAKNGNIGTFWLELILAVFIPFMIWWSMTPTNVLNSSSLFGLLEHIGIGGSVLIFFVGIPVGIIGIRKAKEMQKRKIATIVLSVLNLSAGIIEIGTFILVFCAAIFGGVSA